MKEKCAIHSYETGGCKENAIGVADGIPTCLVHWISYTRCRVGSSDVFFPALDRCYRTIEVYAVVKGGFYMAACKDHLMLSDVNKPLYPNYMKIWKPNEKTDNL